MIDLCTLQASCSRRAVSRLSRRVGYVAILAVSLLLFAPASAHAQPTTGGAEGIVTDFSRPGQPSMIIYLWGGVSRPGLWRVERDVDLVQLLTAAGVPSIGTDPAGTRRRTFIRVYRTSGDNRTEVFEQRVDRLLAEGSTYPPLQAEDIVEVQVKERRAVGIQLIGTLVSTASAVTLLVLRLTSGS
jgi:hypothetical protein